MAVNPQPEQGPKPVVAAAWLQLQQRFQAGLAERVLALQAAADRPEELQGLLHRLVGAAGAYGDHALAENARRMMHALAAAPAGPLELDARTTLDALCGLCVQRAEQASQPRS